jgi:hypothetical protein
MKMRQFWKTAICLAFILIFLNFAQAQTLKTAKGNFCGFSEGDGGYVSIRVGNAEKTFAILADEPAIKYAGFKNERQKNLFNLPVGTEIIVSYTFKKPRYWNRSTNVVTKLTLTGKANKKTKPCSED